MAREIRRLTAGDAQLLKHLAEGVFDEAVDFALAAEFLQDARHHLYAAIDEGVVVGFASAVHYVHPDKPAQLWINEVGVAPSHHGKGIGKALMAAVLERGRELGCSEAWVLTEDNNAAARALYRSAGGTETSGVVMVTFPLNREAASDL